MPDVEEHLPGKGIWLSANVDMIKKACTKNLFSKAARMTVVVPADLVEQVEALLVRRCLSLIGLARRAGQAVAGFERVRQWLAAGRAGLLMAAADGSPRSRARVQALAGETPVVSSLRSDELGVAAGREHAVFVVIAPGNLAERLRREAGRLAGLRRPGIA